MDQTAIRRRPRLFVNTNVNLGRLRISRRCPQFSIHVPLVSLVLLHLLHVLRGRSNVEAALHWAAMLFHSFPNALLYSLRFAPTSMTTSRAPVANIDGQL